MCWALVNSSMVVSHTKLSDRYLFSNTNQKLCPEQLYVGSILAINVGSMTLHSFCFCKPLDWLGMAPTLPTWPRVLINGWQQLERFLVTGSTLQQFRRGGGGCHTNVVISALALNCSRPGFGSCTKMSWHHQIFDSWPRGWIRAGLYWRAPLVLIFFRNHAQDVAVYQVRSHVWSLLAKLLLTYFCLE